MRDGHSPLSTDTTVGKSLFALKEACSRKEQRKTDLWNKLEEIQRQYHAISLHAETAQKSLKDHDDRLTAQQTKITNLQDIDGAARRTSGEGRDATTMNSLSEEDFIYIRMVHAKNSVVTQLKRDRAELRVLKGQEGYVQATAETESRLYDALLQNIHETKRKIYERRQSSHSSSSGSRRTSKRSRDEEGSSVWGKCKDWVRSWYGNENYGNGEKLHRCGQEGRRL